MTSEHVVFSQIPSMIPDKYYYPKSDTCSTMMFYLFSDQSMLAYSERFRCKYRNLYELLNAEDMSINEFAVYQEPAIRWLIAQGCLILTDNGLVKVKKEKSMILKDLYENEVGCTSYIGHARTTLQEMVDHEEVRFGSTLFSEPEQKYFNYVLNRRDYSNGLDLRKKYVHGSYPLDPNTQEIDYCELLKILVTILIKINEEYCILDDIKYKTGPA